MKSAFLVLFIPLLASAQTAQEIMAKVAENQERADAARAGFVYQQKILVRMKRSNGQLAREEDREYTVTPGPDGIERELVHFSGKYGVKGSESAISEPGEHYQDKDIDANVTKNLADGFGNDEKSRDGINQNLFPLTARKQKGYVFKLAGSETWHGREAFRITFEPIKRENAASWAGEVLVDKIDLTAVLVTTHLARGVPVVVKTLLGTNVQQIGFKLTYEKFDDNLWFPVNYSGELKLRVLFLYGRTISLGMINSEFRRAEVKSTITFEK